MSSHAMRTVAVSVMTLSFKAYTVGFALWAGTMPPPVPPVHGRRSWRLLLLLVDVLDDLGIGGGRPRGGGRAPGPGVGRARPRGEIASRIDVISGLGAAECAASGQAGLHAGVGRTPVDVVVRVVHFFHPGTRAPAGLPHEHAPANPAVAAARDRDPEDADDHDHVAGGVQVEDGRIRRDREREDGADSDQYQSHTGFHEDPSAVMASRLFQAVAADVVDG